MKFRLTLAVLIFLCSCNLPEEDKSLSSTICPFWSFTVNDSGTHYFGKNITIRRIGATMIAFGSDYEGGVFTEQIISPGMVGSFDATFYYTKDSSESWYVDVDIGSKAIIEILKNDGSGIQGILKGTLHHSAINQDEEGPLSFEMMFEIPSESIESTALEVCYMTQDKEQECLNKCFDTYTDCCQQCSQKPIPRDRAICFGECSNQHATCRRACRD